MSQGRHTPDESNQQQSGEPVGMQLGTKQMEDGESWGLGGRGRWGRKRGPIRGLPAALHEFLLNSVHKCLSIHATEGISAPYDEVNSPSTVSASLSLTQNVSCSLPNNLGKEHKFSNTLMLAQAVRCEPTPIPVQAFPLFTPTGKFKQIKPHPFKSLIKEDPQTLHLEPS